MKYTPYRYGVYIGSIQLSHVSSHTKKYLIIICRGQYADNEATFKVKLCGAPCAEPCCWMGSMLLWPCAQYKLRYMSLNHVEPGSGWSNYQCCQGMFGGCCCIQPGNMGESSCPQCCMCLEGCLLPGMAVSASQGVIMQRYGLGLDSDDVKLIRCNNCLQLLACVASCLNICIDFDGDDGELMVLCFLVTLQHTQHISSSPITATIYQPLSDWLISWRILHSVVWVDAWLLVYTMRLKSVRRRLLKDKKWSVR